MYDNNSWQLFLLHRRKKERNCTSVTLAGPTQSELTPWHPKYSTFICCSLLFKSECNSGYEGTQCWSVQRECFILKIPTHPALQNTQRGSKPGKTHASNCLQVCPLPWILRTYHNSRRKDVKNAFLMLTEYKLKNAFKKQRLILNRKWRSNKVLVGYLSVPKHYKSFPHCQQTSALIPCNYCSYSR